MALSADRAPGYAGELAVETPARPRPPRRSRTLQKEARLAYTILGPTLLVLVAVVVYEKG